MPISLNPAALDILKDSHAYFLPAQKAYRHSYGCRPFSLWRQDGGPVPAQSLRRWE
jgi:hypothetical protein